MGNQPFDLWDDIQPTELRWSGHSIHSQWFTRYSKISIITYYLFAGDTQIYSLALIEKYETQIFNSLSNKSTLISHRILKLNSKCLNWLFFLPTLHSLPYLPLGSSVSAGTTTPNLEI